MHTSVTQIYYWFRILYSAKTKNRAANDLCVATNKNRQGLSSMFRSESNSAQSSATFSSRVFFKSKSGKEREWKTSLYTSIAQKNLFDTPCEMLYILEIYQPDLVHIEVNRKPPTGFTGLWFRLCVLILFSLQQRRTVNYRGSPCSVPLQAAGSMHRAPLRLLPCSSLMGAPLNSPGCYCSGGFNNWYSTLIALKNSIYVRNLC